ncbi:MAG: hypothetical protein HC892_17970 [Saprospiraceae bacterium]|nr:hypothetical protein [Saprospiraceae bacterium]
MRKIFVLNNYSFQRVWQEVQDALKPNHHLYGINYLEQYGYELVLVPFDDAQKHFTTRFSRFWKKASYQSHLAIYFSNCTFFDIAQQRT